MAKPGPSGQTPVSCDICHKTFKDRSGLSGHKQFAHRIHPRTGTVSPVSEVSPAQAVKSLPPAGGRSQPHLEGQRELASALRRAEESVGKQLEQLETRLRILEADWEASTQSSAQRWTTVQEQLRRLGDFSLSIAVIADETSYDVHGDELQDSESPWRYSEIQLKMHDVLRQFLEDEDWREQAALLGGIESGASLEDNHI